MAIDSSFVGQTYIGTGGAVAPLAGAQIAGITAPPKGFYRIVVKYGYGATGETSNPNNFFLSVNGAQYQSNTLFATFGANVSFEAIFERVYLDGVNNVRIAPNQNASAGAVYLATIYTTMLSN